MQQGRVLTDADWNEQIDIQDDKERTSLIHIIGKSGVPSDFKEGNSFKIVPEEGNRYIIKEGRMYVDGTLVENFSDVQGFSVEDGQEGAQPYLPTEFDNGDHPTGDAVPKDVGSYMAYLDVWARHITFIEDPEIKESALGGPDTTTRSKVVWQVKLHKLPGNPEDCDSAIAPWASKKIPRLQARIKPEQVPFNSSMLSELAGYKGLENQLYRIEIHDPNSKGKNATFKISKDNGSVCAKVVNISSDKITVESTGRDLRRFSDVQIVEITDDFHDLLGRRGVFVYITSVEGNELTYKISDKNRSDHVIPVDNNNFPQKCNPKIRAWDSLGEVKTSTKNDEFQAINDSGIEIKFDGNFNGVYQTGDYWTIPARTLRV